MNRALALAIIPALALAACKGERKLTRAPSDAKQMMAGPFTGYTVTQVGGGGVEGVTWSQAAKLVPQGADASRAGMAMLQVSNHELPNKPDASGVPRFGGAQIENATGVHTVEVQGIKLYVGNEGAAPFPLGKVAAWFIPFSNAHAIVYAPDEKTATEMAGTLLRAWMQQPAK